MDTYRFEDQLGIHTWTQSKILGEYYDYWKSKMIEVGKVDMISEKNCIEDWVTVNWAWSVDD